MSDARPVTDVPAPVVLDVRADLDAHPWQLPAETARAEIRSVGLIRDGAGSHRASVAILAVLPNGAPVVVETTLRLARAAVRGLTDTNIVRGEA